MESVSITIKALMEMVSTINKGGPMSETTTVTETVTEPETQTDDAPEVIVVDTGDNDSGDDGTTLAIGEQLGALTVTVGALGETVASLNERMDALAARTEFAETVAIDAATEVAEAVEQAEEIAEETASDTVDEIIEPQREHWMWRNPVKVRRGQEGED